MYTPIGKTKIGDDKKRDSKQERKVDVDPDNAATNRQSCQTMRGSVITSYRRWTKFESCARVEVKGKGRSPKKVVKKVGGYDADVNGHPRDEREKRAERAVCLGQALLGIWRE